MAQRKPPEDTSRAILMLRTAEFMAASQVWCFVRRQQKLAQDRTFQRREIGRPAPAGTRNINSYVMGDATVFDDQHAISQRDGFGHVVGDQDRRKRLIVPDPLQ